MAARFIGNEIDRPILIDFFLSIQALAAQKFREQQEAERRKHLEQMRFRESDKLAAVSERRKAIESATMERKEAMLKKAHEREEKIAEDRRKRESRSHYAFGSSTPRTLHPNMGSNGDIWGAVNRYGFLSHESLLPRLQ